MRETWKQIKEAWTLPYLILVAGSLLILVAFFTWLSK